METSNVRQSLQRLVKALSELDLPFVVSGALAVNHYGHLRATTDINLLMTKAGLAVFKEKYIGLGWLNKFEGSKGFRDTITNIPIDVPISGDFPGAGKPKEIAFTDPKEVADFDEYGVPYLCLAKLIELKLASGMTAPDRPRDFDDVIQLIRKNDLPQTYGDALNPYVHESWHRMWTASRYRDEY